MAVNFSLETLKRIYDDTTGDYLEIGPDPSVPGLLEIRSYSTNPLTRDTILVTRIAFPPDIIPLLVQSLESFKLT